MGWMRVDEVMTSAVLLLTTDTPYRRIVELFAERGISGAPVVASTGVVLGVVSETDLLAGVAESGDRAPRRRLLHRHAADAGGVDAVGARTARDLMTFPALVVAPEAAVAEAARIMIDNHINRLPVVNGQGRVAGIVTRGDLLRAFRRTDEAIRTEIVDDVFRLVLRVGPPDVDVRVRAGLATLTGELSEAGDVDRAVRLVRHIDGVTGVVNDLTYRGGGHRVAG